MRAIALLAAAVLAGCSGSGEKAQQPGVEASEAPPRTSATSAVSSPSAETSSGAKLIGQVSDLSSTVSGLDVRITDAGTVIALPADALFEFDKADLSAGASEQLFKTAELIRGAPAGPLRIVGHSDSKGDDAYNLKLSEARARTVAEWLGRQVGVRQRKFVVEGRGETAPLAPNETRDGKDDPAGRARNRRVEVILGK